MANFKTSIELVSFLKGKDFHFNAGKSNVETLQINETISIDFNLILNKFCINGITADRRTIFDLTKPENHNVVMLLIKLLKKGYALSSITLEKSWQTGHSPVYLDVMLRNQANGDVFMFEVKTFSEFRQYANADHESKVKQLLSYAMQEQKTKIASFYSYNFDEEKDCFANIYCKDLREHSLNSDDFFDRWNKIFDESDFIANSPVFNIKKTVKTFGNLKQIKEDDTKSLFKQFLTILRLNSISDKPTAFMKMINLFLAKLADEISEDQQFKIKDKYGNNIIISGMKFQNIEDETPESFMKRLDELYKAGMHSYLKKDVIDYSDEELGKLVNGNANEKRLMKVFDDLRLKKNINFSFIEIYDEDTFLENYTVVRDIVRLIENYRLKYETKCQFLGDFFEELLNTSLKQEAGQFFTPYPIVDFMIKSLDFEQRINKAIVNRSIDFIPTVIDYACGAGHFLISAMSEIQYCLSNIDGDGLTHEQRLWVKTYKENPYSWADDKKIVGIEKDYRLAKTSKIAQFLNGDGNAEIIAGDGINKFNCNEYQKTILYSNDQKNEIFDFVVSNPPYSVNGFMLNFRKNDINKDSGTFTLLDSEINEKNAAIEIYFVERMEQLLKMGGIGAIILPQSVLSNEKYEKMRNFLFSNFKILSMLLTADITFSGTTTSPVVLFLRKENIENLQYDILIHQSPKYTNPNASKLKRKEEQFLGYEFSSNRNKAGITIFDKSVLSELVSITKLFIINGTVTISSNFNQYSRIVSLSEILLNKSVHYCGDIYPKRLICEGEPLSMYCKINEWKEIDFADTNPPNEYLEIGNMQDQVPTKNKQTKRYCKAGDILVSSLTPRKNQIIIAERNFMLTTAIFVLSSFRNEDVRDSVFEALRSDETVKQMNAFLDGFKATYAKISEQNLYNNVFINI